MNHQEFKLVYERVCKWGKEFDSDTYNYGSKATLWRNAKADGIITQQEYDFADNYYGEMFYWTGD
jgi:hypothetical protein